MMARFLCIVIGLATSTATVQAGLYNPAEPLDGQLPEIGKLTMQGFKGSYRQFKDFALDPLRSIGMSKVLVDNPLRVRYRMIADSATAFGARGMSEQQQLSLSEYLIRRNDPNLHLQAARLLENLAGEKRSFLTLANLGTEFQMTGDLLKAVDRLKQAVDAWPEDWEALKPELKTQLREMRWTEIEFAWFRKVEGYHHKLAELRFRENPKPKERDENVDAIFGTAFAFPDDEEYVPGKLPEGKTIPHDALQIVQQLLVWLPHDRRLQWLLGEVYNARGDVESARAVMKDLSVSFSVSPYRPRLLTGHYQILNAAKLPTAIAKTDADKGKTSLPPPNLIDWRSLGVGFGTGVVFAFMGYWQIREIMRRRRK